MRRLAIPTRATGTRRWAWAAVTGAIWSPGWRRRPATAGLDRCTPDRGELLRLRQLPATLRLEVDGRTAPLFHGDAAEAERVPLGGSAVAVLRPHRKRRGR